MSDLVCMAKIRTAHGIKGLVKLDCYNEDPSSLPAWNPLTDETGTREFRLNRVAAHKDFYLAEIEGVTDRNEAEALRGVHLYVPRNRLPEIAEENTWYSIDLIGVDVFHNGAKTGTVKSVQNFGAGNLLEISSENGEIFFLPFIDAFVPEVDLDAGKIVITPPTGLLE